MDRPGSFERSDLTNPGARRRAGVWIVVCTVLVVGLLVIAATERSWIALLAAVNFAVLAVRTARRLAASGREPV